jgi:hypothetical protein
MLTIECPNCKRGLRAPDESGDHRVVCPGCNVAFAVVFDGGVLRVVSSCLLIDQPPEALSNQPIAPIESDDRPVWVPLVAVDVENDEAARRTRRLNYTFLIATSSFFAFSLYGGVTQEMGDHAAGGLIALAFFSVVVGSTVTLFVGYFLTPSPVDPHAEREKRLRLMNKAERAVRRDSSGGDTAPLRASPDETPPRDSTKISQG